MRNRRFVKPRAEGEEQGQEDQEEQDENKVSGVSAHTKVQAEQTQAVLQSKPVRGSIPRKAVRPSQEGRPRLGAGGAEGAEAVHMGAGGHREEPRIEKTDSESEEETEIT